MPQTTTRTTSPTPAPAPAAGEPLGYRPGLTPATNVLTLDGALPMDWIEVGERVITRDRGMAVVRGITNWTYHGPLVLVKQDALGENRPTADFRLVPSQILRMRAPDDDRIPRKVTAMDLVTQDGVDLIHPDCPVRLYDLWFDQPHIIFAEGLELLAGLSEA